MLLAALLTTEFLLLRQGNLVKSIRALERADLAYVTCGVLALLSGALRFGTSAKGIGFYAGHPMFWLKLFLFGTLALTSFLVTRHYSRWAHHARMDTTFTVPATEVCAALTMVKIQMALLALLPLLATLMARNIFL